MRPVLTSLVAGTIGMSLLLLTQGCGSTLGFISNYEVKQIGSQIDNYIKERDAGKILRTNRVTLPYTNTVSVELLRTPTEPYHK